MLRDSEEEGKMEEEEEEEAAVEKLNKKNLMDVEEDVVCRILLMLPVKSLLICRAVCKEWRRLISSAGFIRLHLNKSKENPNFTPRGRALAHSLEFGEFIFYRKFLSFEFEKESNMWLGAVINGLGFWLSYRPSSSGRPELPGAHQIYIHNPATRRVTWICETRSGRLQPKIAVAFGPDGRIDKYNVYAIFQKNGDSSRYYDECECEVYCSVTKSWKLIGDVAPAACWVRYSRSVNGIVYWVVGFRRGGGDGIIPLPMAMIAIDWNGSVTTISLPREVTYDGLLNLIEFEGCLSLIFCHDNLFDLWVLKDDGIDNESSWVQRCCSAMPFDKKCTNSRTHFVVARKNEILFLLRDVKVVPFNYLVYNVDEGTWRAVLEPGFIEPTPCLYDCTESLLPIPCKSTPSSITTITL